MVALTVVCFLSPFLTLSLSLSLSLPATLSLIPYTLSLTPTQTGAHYHKHTPTLSLSNTHTMLVFFLSPSHFEFFESTRVPVLGSSASTATAAALSNLIQESLFRFFSWTLVKCIRPLSLSLSLSLSLTLSHVSLSLSLIVLSLFSNG